MAEKFPLFTSCKLTISNKVPRNDGELFKLIVDKLQFKITEFDPLVIEKDCPTQQDILMLFANLKPFYEAQELNQQTHKQDARSESSMQKAAQTSDKHHQLENEGNKSKIEERAHKEERAYERSQLKNSATEEHCTLPLENTDDNSYQLMQPRHQKLRQEMSENNYDDVVVSKVSQIKHGLGKESDNSQTEESTAKMPILLQKEMLDVKGNEKYIPKNKNSHEIKKPLEINSLPESPRASQSYISEQDLNVSSSSVSERSHPETGDYSISYSEDSGHGAFSNITYNDLSLVSNESKFKVKIYKADITELPVDCIVNTADQLLEHFGGLAKVVAGAAGPDLRKECKDFINAGNFVDVTDIFLTTGGKLPAKYVIHAVGPRWDDYDDESKVLCFEDLRHTVLRCLVEAGKRRLTSIAIPSISSAIGMIPKEQCARCYMEAVKHFDIFNAEEKYTLEEIHFVDVDYAMVKLIQECFRISWHKPSDMEIVQEDCEFAKKHLYSSSKNETANHSRKLGEEKKSQDHKTSLSLSRPTKELAAASSLAADETFELSAVYNFGKITLQVDSRFALEYTSDIIIIFGKPFDKLSGIPDFKISKSKKSEDMQEKENAHMFLTYLIQMVQSHFCCVNYILSLIIRTTQ